MKLKLGGDSQPSGPASRNTICSTSTSHVYAVPCNPVIRPRAPNAAQRLMYAHRASCRDLQISRTGPYMGLSGTICGASSTSPLPLPSAPTDAPVRHIYLYISESVTIQGHCGPKKYTLANSRTVRRAYLGHCCLGHHVVAPEVVGQVDEVDDGVRRHMEPVQHSQGRACCEISIGSSFHATQTIWKHVIMTTCDDEQAQPATAQAHPPG